MNKIYYYQQEVKIGDKVVINGVALKVTEQLIEDNPDLFKVAEEQEILEYVECTKLVRGNTWPAIGEILPVTKPDCNGQQAIHNVCMVGSILYKNCFKPSTKEAWLLQEAKRRYPKGTKFRSAAQPDKRIIISDGIFNIWASGAGVSTNGMLIYYNDQWAEIVKPLFTTEDGVEIFKGDEYWWFYDGLDPKIMHASDGAHENSGKKPNAKYFSTCEAAEEYIAKHKEKTLEDYESELDEITSISGYSVYRWLKDNDRKLYYTKVLNAIADDLNDEKCVNRIFIKRHGGDYIPIFDKESLRGTPMFASKSDAMKAIKIMGDKLDIIFTNNKLF
jgi:hypothetical protein